MREWKGKWEGDDAVQVTTRSEQIMVVVKPPCIVQ